MTADTEQSRSQALTVAETVAALSCPNLRSNEHLTVQVEVFNPGTLGGTPRVAVTSIQAGFDWDAGVMLLKTAMPITTLSPESVEAIRASARQGQSWHAYQAHKRQHERIKALEAEIAALKSGCKPTPVPPGYKLVPILPSEEQLTSMAVRSDHGLGVPGYYDSCLFAADGVTHEQRLEGAKRQMSQLYEEGIGEGFLRLPELPNIPY